MSVEQPTVSNNRPVRKATTGQDALTRILTGTHTFLYRLSGGKIGGRFGKSPVLLLTTTGRKTGKQRTTPLLYLKDDDKLVIVASHGGAPTHPIWWLNLQAKPQAEVEIGGQKLVVVARQADAEERNRLWPLLVAMYPSYAAYQKKTTREIPVILLHPQST